MDFHFQLKNERKLNFGIYFKNRRLEFQIIRHFILTDELKIKFSTDKHKKKYFKFHIIFYFSQAFSIE